MTRGKGLRSLPRLPILRGGPRCRVVCEFVGLEAFVWIRILRMHYLLKVFRKHSRPRHPPKVSRIASHSVSHLPFVFSERYIMRAIGQFWEPICTVTEC